MQHIESTYNNIKIVSHQGEQEGFGKIDFVSPGQGFISGYHLQHTNGQGFVPEQFLVEDGGRKMLFPTKSTIVHYDTETGANLGDFQVACPNSTAVTLRDVAPCKKFGNLDSQGEYGLVFVSEKSAGNLLWDVRQNQKGKLTVKEKDFLSYKKGNLQVAATSKSGHLAIGDGSGVVRLYSDPSKKGMIRAKTNIDQVSFGDPIIGMDVSADGEWVLWTTQQRIFLCNTKFRDDKNELSSGFEKRMGDNKKDVLIIQLSDSELKRMGISKDKVCFTPAKFDNSSHLGSLESIVATTCGPFIVTWKMRNLTKDYQKGRFSMAAENKDRKANIIQLEDNILTDTFGFGMCTNVLSSVLSEEIKDVRL